MFRRFDIESTDGYIYQLYKNRSEILEDISPEFIKKHTFKLREPSSFDLEIPKYLGKEKRFNPLFLKTKSKQQVIIKDSNNNKERYILEARKEMASNKNGSKKFTGYSFEKTLQKQKITIPEGNYQLMSDETHIAKGILELAVEDSMWTISHVDDSCRNEKQITPVTVPTVLQSGYRINNIQYGTVLIDKAINTTQLQPNTPLYLTMEYNTVVTYKNGKKIKTENIFNVLDPLYTQATHIKGVYFQEPGNRWGIQYEITLKDGVKEVQTHTFTNVTNLDIEVKECKLLYETGKYEEIDMIQYPFFGSFDDSVYNILKDLEEVFNCVFIFDTYNKTISCYDKETYGAEKGLLLSLDTNVVELNVSEDESIPNGVKVVGKEGLSIIEENIFGSDTIYNYDYYIKEGLIPQDMVDSWNRYKTFAGTQNQEWGLLKSNRQLAKSEQIAKSSEATSLGRRISNMKVLLAGYVESGDKANQEKTQKELTDLESKFNTVSARINELDTLLSQYEESMGEVSGKLDRKSATDSKGKIFTEEHLNIFDDIEEVYSVSDNYYSTPYALLGHYEKELEEKVVPTIDFDMDTPTLVKAIPNWTKILTLGDLFEVDKDMENLLQQKFVRLLEIDYLPKEKRIPSVKFCNKDEKVNKLKNMNGAGRKQSQAVNTNNQFKNIWEDSVGANNYVSSLREKGMTLVTNAINSKSDSCVLDMGSAGIWVKNAEDEKRQVAITSGIIAITTDGWKTSDTAITPDFINADLLMGRIIAGENLYITSEDGGFYVGNTSNGKKVEDFGIKITQDGSLGAKERIFLGLETDSDGIRRAKLRLTSPQDNSVVLDERGILNSNFYEVWDNLSPGSPLVTNFPVDSGVQSIKQVILKVRLQRYRGFTKAVKSGGWATSSGPSSRNTAAEEGSHRHVVAYATDYQQDPADMIVKTFAMSSSEGNYNAVPINMEIFKYNYNVGTLWTAGAKGTHSHDMRHTHTIDFTHGHEMEMGIYEGDMARDCTLRINGQTVRQGINSNQDIDITSYVLINRDNVIEISSPYNGRVSLGIKSKMFTMF